MKRKTLPIEYALVLRQISKSSWEDFEYLADNMRLSQAQLAHIIQELHHKGLIVSRRASTGLWLRLSAKGKKVIGSLQPAPTLMPTSTI